MQADLFQLEDTPNTRLEAYEAQGIQFLSIAQAATVLGYTDYEVRYVISLYRLDAVLVGGFYRIPLSAIKTFLLSDEQEAFFVYYKAISAVELKGAYALVTDGSIEAIRDSLRARRRPLTEISEIIEKDHFYSYAEMPGNEPDPQDWYDLQELKWPPSGASVADYAAVLDIHPKYLAYDIGKASQDPLEWPEFYDFLIEHEVINLPCPFNAERPSFKELETDQLELFT